MLIMQIYFVVHWKNYLLNSKNVNLHLSCHLQSLVFFPLLPPNLLSFRTYILAKCCEYSIVDARTIRPFLIGILLFCRILKKNLESIIKDRIERWFESLIKNVCESFWISRICWKSRACKKGVKHYVAHYKYYTYVCDIRKKSTFFSFVVIIYVQAVYNMSMKITFNRIIPIHPCSLLS